MDLGIPLVGGVEPPGCSARRCPPSRSLIVTASENEAHLIAALYAGAKGYVLKTGDPAQLVRSVEAIADGQGFLSPEVTSQIPRASAPGAGPPAGDP